MAPVPLPSRTPPSVNVPTPVPPSATTKSVIPVIVPPVIVPQSRYAVPSMSKSFHSKLYSPTSPPASQQVTIFPLPFL